MESESLVTKVESELKRWSAEEEKSAARAGNILLRPARRLTLEPDGQHGVTARSEDAADDPSFVREAPIDLAGPWRTVLHCKCWWVAGHHFLHPCRDERDADRRLEKLREDWQES